MVNTMEVLLFKLYALLLFSLRLIDIILNITEVIAWKSTFLHLFTWKASFLWLQKIHGQIQDAVMHRLHTYL